MLSLQVTCFGYHKNNDLRLFFIKPVVLIFDLFPMCQKLKMNKQIPK